MRHHQALEILGSCHTLGPRDAGCLVGLGQGELPGVSRLRSKIPPSFTDPESPLPLPPSQQGSGGEFQRVGGQILFPWTLHLQLGRRICSMSSTNHPSPFL